MRRIDEVSQKGKGGRPTLDVAAITSDLMAVPINSRAYLEAKDVRDLPASLLHQAEVFFTEAVAGTRKPVAVIRRAEKEFERYRGDGGGAAT